MEVTNTKSIMYFHSQRNHSNKRRIYYTLYRRRCRNCENAFLCKTSDAAQLLSICLVLQQMMQGREMFYFINGIHPFSVEWVSSCRQNCCPLSYTFTRLCSLKICYTGAGQHMSCLVIVSIIQVQLPTHCLLR